MTVPHIAACAEFPNDNPDLHHGVRWVCRDPRGAARAVLRAGSDGLVSGGGLVAAMGETASAPPPEARPAARAPDAAVDAIDGSEAGLTPAPAARASEAVRAPTEPGVAPAAPPERVYRGPLELDLGRIVLVHRVENIPPPPDFIFIPFVSSRRRELPPQSAGAVPPIEPRACQVVDERQACQRVARGWRVDVAPCVHVGAPAGTSAQEPRRERRRAARALGTRRDGERLTLFELEAAGA